MKLLKSFFHAIGKVFHVLNIGLQTITRLVLLCILMLGIYWFTQSSSTQALNSNSVMVLDLGAKVRDKSTESGLLSQVVSGKSRPDTQLQQLTQALDQAAQDSRVQAVLLRLDELDSVGLASTQEIGSALDRFKKSKKPLWAWGAQYTQAQYAIAAHADKIFLHPLGAVQLKGLSSERLYWGESLRKLGVNVHVFKAGTYKSAPEIFTRQAPSQEALQAEHVWLDSAWQTYCEDIERARGLKHASIVHYLNHLDELVENEHGDMTALALRSGFIDGIMTHAQMNQWIEQQLKNHGEKVSYFSFSDWILPNRTAQGSGIGVIVAEGEISDDEQADDAITAKQLISEFEQAKNNEAIKAVVLRINSPGGAVMASELIRQSLLQLKQSKPVIVSMGDTAASGGYWIASAADSIVAEPNSITGSIGVFGIVPTFENSLKHLGMGSGGVSTAWPAQNRLLVQDLDARTVRILKSNIQHTYRTFVNLVAQARGLTQNQVHQLAQGKVWTGTQAKQLQLVDHLGGLDLAMGLAREKAGLGQDCAIYYLSEDSVSFKSLLKSVINPSGLPFKGAIPESVNEQLHWANDFFDRQSKNDHSIVLHSLLWLYI